MTPDEFKAWRKGTGLSQQEVADFLGVSRGSIENYERGHRREDNRPVEIPASISRLVTMTAYLAKEMEITRDRIELFRSGKLGYVDIPTGKDITPEAIEADERRLADLTAVLERYKPAS